jgi:hypothetical protein
MPDFPSRADDTVPLAGDSALNELLTAGQPPQHATAGLQPVAEVLAALRAGPADAELAGQARALAQFRSTVRVSHRAAQRRARRPLPFRARLSSKLAIITGATAVAVSGTVAAAYVGVLPGPLQRAAHDVLAAPAHGRPAPAVIRARSLPTPAPASSAAVSPSPVTGHPGLRHGQARSARKHYRHKRHGHHQGHRGWAAHHQGMPGEQHNYPSPAARDNNATAGSRATGTAKGRLPAATTIRWPITREADCNRHSPEQPPSRVRPQVPTGRGSAGAEPRARVPTPGGPGPRSLSPRCGVPPAEGGPGWLGQGRPVP